MSNIFLKNDLNGIFDTLSESNISLPNWVTIIDKATKTEDNTDSVTAKQIGGTFLKTSINNKKISNKIIGGSGDDSTSSAFLTQMNVDEEFSATSSVAYNKKIDGSDTSSAFLSNMDRDVSATSSVAYTKKINDDDTSSAFLSNMDGDVSATSYNNSNMLGGTNDDGTSSINVDLNKNDYSATSYMSTNNVKMTMKGGNKLSSVFINQNTNNVKDVNKLISMLTSDSSSVNLQGLSQTSTDSLENQLRNILNQDGGAKKTKSTTKKQKGGNLNVDDVKHFFLSLKSQGVDVDVKLNSKSMSEFFNLADETTTDVSIANISATSEINNNSNGLALALSATSPDDAEAMIGGAKKTKGKKTSTKAKKSNKQEEQDGGVNPGFQAFLDLKKYIAEKLSISNGPQAAKVAGAVQREMKEKFPELDSVKIADEGKKHFNKNIDHFKQMLVKK